MSSSAPLQVNLHQTHRRVTHPRQIVLEVVKKAKRRLTPGEIYERARAKYPHIGLATIYRSLDLLVQLGYIQRIHLTEGCHSYAPIEQRHGHHLVCANCGRIEEFAGGNLEPLIQTLRAKTGYTIGMHVFELIGRCPACQRKGRALNRQGKRRNFRSKETTAN